MSYQTRVAWLETRSSGCNTTMSEKHRLYRRSFIKGATVTGIVGLSGCLNQKAGSRGGGGTGNSEGSGDKLTWQLGTSSEGSSSYRIGSTWTEYAKQNDLLDSVKVDAIVTEGTSASYRRLDAGQFELSGTTTQLLAASPDAGTFKEKQLKAFDSIRQIRGYMSFYNFGLYNADKVSGWNDLEGRPIAISSAGSGTRPLVEWLVDQEIGLDSVDNRYMAFSDIPAALRSGQVDAAFTWTLNESIPQGFYQEIDSTVNWKPLEISKSTIQALKSDLSHSKHIKLDEKTVSEFSKSYQGPLDTFTLSYLYVAKKDQNPDIVYNITKYTHEHGEKLLKQDDGMGAFPDPDKFLGQLHPDVPVHEGAYKYYKEKGLWKKYDLTAPPETQQK